MNDPSCPNCGFPISIENVIHGSLQEQVVIYIRWDKTHTSAPIGPYSHAEAVVEAKAIRKKMRAAGRNPVGAVEIKYLRPAGAWKGWEMRPT